MHQEETKAKQAVYDARGNRQHNQVQTMRVLHPSILAKLNTLPTAERVRFVEAVRMLDTMPMPEQKRQEQLRSLCETLFISSEKRQVRSTTTYN